MNGASPPQPEHTARSFSTVSASGSSSRICSPSGLLLTGQVGYTATLCCQLRVNVCLSGAHCSTVAAWFVSTMVRYALECMCTAVTASKAKGHTVAKGRRWNVPSRAAMITTLPSLAHFSANFAMSAQHGEKSH